MRLKELIYQRLGDKMLYHEYSQFQLMPSLISLNLFHSQRVAGLHNQTHSNDLITSDKGRYAIDFMLTAK